MPKLRRFSSGHGREKPPDRPTAFQSNATFTGTQIDESSLGIVPNADQLDGQDSTDFLPSSSIFTGLHNDDPDGHAQGWNPDGVDSFFTITDSRVPDELAVIAMNLSAAVENFCTPNAALGSFSFSCNVAPSNGATLKYAIIAP